MSGTENLPLHNPPDRIDYLDSLRGLACLYVAVGHVLVDKEVKTFTPAVRVVMALLDEGKLSVALFIVLSGYCLMLPVARSGGWRLGRGFGNYIFRRARRIYPPYLAAMALSLGFIALLPAALAGRSFWLSTFKPAFTWDVLLSHLTMTHNLSNAWLYKINAPFWSVATEWQIYFMFPVLLWLAGRAGMRVTVVAALVMALAPIFVFRRFETAAPWFLCLFAMGMLAAAVVHSPVERYERYRRSRMWGWLALGSAVAMVAGLLALAWSGKDIGWKRNLMSQLALGVSAMAGLVWLAGGGRWAARARHMLHWRPMIGLGRISYSLYLTHAIPVCLVGMVMATVCPDWSAGRWLLVKAVVGGGLSVAFAVLFYIPFERPFLNVRRGGGGDAARVRLKSPAAAEVAAVA